MKKQIVDKTEFERLTEGLSKDLVRARIHYELYKDLISSVSEYEHVLNNSKTFWSLTFDAHLDASIYCVCRAYDQNVASLHLKSWLETIRDNLHLFDTEQGRMRLSGEYLAGTFREDAKTPDKKLLQDDIEAVSKGSKTVKKLIRLRGTGYAHRGYAITMKNQIHESENILTFDEFEKLIEKGIEILNRYSVLFSCMSYSSSIIGNDDYRFLLKTLQTGYDAYEQEFESGLMPYKGK